jgi:hypothetical protein
METGEYFLSEKEQKMKKDEIKRKKNRQKKMEHAI